MYHACRARESPANNSLVRGGFVLIVANISSLASASPIGMTLHAHTNYIHVSIVYADSVCLCPCFDKFMIKNAIAHKVRAFALGCESCFYSIYFVYIWYIGNALFHSLVSITHTSTRACVEDGVRDDLLLSSYLQYAWAKEIAISAPYRVIMLRSTLTIKPHTKNISRLFLVLSPLTNHMYIAPRKPRTVLHMSPYTDNDRSIAAK